MENLEVDERSSGAASSSSAAAGAASVPVNEDPYYYVATIYKGTVITHSVVGNFISSEKKTLVVS